VDLSFLAGIFASPWNIILSLIDIAIVAYIFYRILGLIRGTRAVQLLKGLILLLVFAVIARSLGLEMVTWLVDKFFILSAIAVPIVFQPELRRILERIGEGRFFSSQGLPETYANKAVISEITQAANILSISKTGALIVITRRTGINEYLQTGVPLDSLVSASLLVNIFVPNTPLHDGAVVITGGRISHAACFLPLSDNPRLAKELGTRHRAGIGITEVSDALALIVSEETGIISLVSEGRLRRNLNTATLSQALTEELVTEEKGQDSWLRRWASEEKSRAGKNN
jgi:diadenylate cyclase